MALIEIDGEISIARGYSFEELRRLPEQVSERAALFGRRDITGVRLSALIEPLRVKTGARFAVVHGAGGYVTNIPVASLVRCTLVYALGERPLWDELGGPLRLFAEGLGSCANVKGVTRISIAVAAAEIAQPCAHQRARTGAVSR